MAKDSQIDKKYVRIAKCNGQTPLTEEGCNHNKNSKHHSIKKEQG